MEVIKTWKVGEKKSHFLQRKIFMTVQNYFIMNLKNSQRSWGRELKGGKKDEI